MFTRNWHKAVGAFIFYKSFNATNFSGSSTPVSNSYIDLKIGNNYDNNVTPSIYKMRNSLSSYGGVIIGTGTTSPTIDDYCLSGDLITNYTYSSSVTKDDENGQTITALYTITNTDTTAFTIGEIGIMCGMSNSASQGNKILLERTVLESPVTIEPGSVGQVTYTITFTYPTA